MKTFLQFLVEASPAAPPAGASPPKTAPSNSPPSGGPPPGGLPGLPPSLGAGPPMGLGGGPPGPPPGMGAGPPGMDAPAQPPVKISKLSTSNVWSALEKLINKSGQGKSSSV